MKKLNWKQILVTAVVTVVAFVFLATPIEDAMANMRNGQQ